MEHAIHNISPIYNSDSQILILGSFPSVKSREAQFFYHHPQNRFWKLLAALSHEDVPVTIADKKAFLSGTVLQYGMSSPPVRLKVPVTAVSVM